MSKTSYLYYLYIKMKINRRNGPKFTINIKLDLYRFKQWSLFRLSDKVIQFYKRPIF